MDILQGTAHDEKLRIAPQGLISAGIAWAIIAKQPSARSAPDVIEERAAGDPERPGRPRSTSVAGKGCRKSIKGGSGYPTCRN
jgi:hypothetical protein